MYNISHLQYLSKKFTCTSKVTLFNIRKGLVMGTISSPLQQLNGSLSNPLRCLKVYFCSVYVFVFAGANYCSFESGFCDWTLSGSGLEWRRWAGRPPWIVQGVWSAVEHVRLLPEFFGQTIAQTPCECFFKGDKQRKK